MEKIFIDLFSGLNGASLVFEEAGWTVIRVDNSPKFRPTIIADIKTLTLRTRAKVVWSSPPCEEFTKRRLPKSWKCNGGKHTEPSMDLVIAAKRIIDEINPEYWIIENVPGAYPYITPYLKMEPKRIGSRYLWGEFPIFDTSARPNKWKMSPSKDRPEKRAKIPRNISMALLKSMEP
jgi:hypothetical protein